MSGPEHYRVAERLLENANQENAERNPDQRRVDLALTAAQVHATLALAAATAMGHGVEGEGMHSLDYEAWDKACGVAEPLHDDEASGG